MVSSRGQGAIPSNRPHPRSLVEFRGLLCYVQNHGFFCVLLFFDHHKEVVSVVLVHLGFFFMLNIMMGSSPACSRKKNRSYYLYMYIFKDSKHEPPTTFTTFWPNYHCLAIWKVCSACFAVAVTIYVQTFLYIPLFSSATNMQDSEGTR